MYFSPDHPAYSRVVAHNRAVDRYDRAYKKAKAAGPEPWNDPAVRAALGRLWYFRGKVPQRGSDSIESVAWERESGRTKGYNNRHVRRSMREWFGQDSHTEKAA